MDSNAGRKQFKKEAQLLAKLQHQNIVKLLEFHSKGEENLFVYEFASNLSLNKYLYGNSMFIWIPSLSS